MSDQGMNLADRQRLIEDHLGWRDVIARPFKRAWPWLADDIESEASIGLITAIDRFDPSRCELKPWLVLKIRMRILVLLRDEMRRAEEPERFKELSRNESPEPNPAFAVASADAFERLLKPLDKLQGQVIRRTYRDGMTFDRDGRRTRHRPREVPQDPIQGARRDSVRRGA